MGVHLVAIQLVKLLKKVQGTESTGTNEMKNQNISLIQTEAGPHRTLRFKELKGLLHIFHNFCINWFLHHTVTPDQNKKRTLVSTYFLERCLSGIRKNPLFHWL